MKGKGQDSSQPIIAQVILYVLVNPEDTIEETAEKIVNITQDPSIIDAVLVKCYTMTDEMFYSDSYNTIVC